MCGLHPDYVIRILQNNGLVGARIDDRTSRLVQHHLILYGSQRIVENRDGLHHGRSQLVRDDLALRQHVTPDLILKRVGFPRDDAGYLLRLYR